MVCSAGQLVSGSTAPKSNSSPDDMGSCAAHMEAAQLPPQRGLVAAAA